MHEYLLCECTLQKSIIDIQLVHGPTTSKSKSKNYFDCLGSDDWSKGFLKIHTWTLGESLGY